MLTNWNPARMPEKDEMKRFSNMYQRNLVHIKINVYQMVFIIIFITAEAQ